MIQSIEDGRKEDGNRSIADKIVKRLHDLDKTVENNQGRWAWELLQNAKDSIDEEEDRAVSVQIELNEDGVDFRHNGTHFTEQDIRGLINQISSKEVEEGQQTKKTGRFGTGFLTTHLLSKVIQVKGIVKTKNNEFYKFEFPLDRVGKTTAQLVPKVESAWEEFHKSAKKISPEYNITEFNTSFYYHLTTEEQKTIAKIGVSEFSKLVPFVLAFIPKIRRVEIIDHITKSNIIFENSEELIDDLIIPISKTENKKNKEVLILYATDNKVSIATEIEYTKNGYSIKNINEIPKLFCDFPLIGTENFHFPVIVNSFFFNPQTERDGIWLKGNDDNEVIENQKLLQSTVALYKDLISQITQKDYFDFYNLSETRTPFANDKYFDEKWYREHIQKPLREVIYNSEIIELETESSEKKSAKDLWFPLKSYPEKIQKKIWKFTFDLFPESVCKGNHLHNWCDLSWDEWKKLNYAELASDLVKQENIENLGNSLGKDEKGTLEWLNSLCIFILEDETNLSLFENNAVTPNQNGIFKEKGSLYIDKIKDNKLIPILKLLGEDWKDILLHPNIRFGKYPVKEKKDIASKITEKLKKPAYKDENSIKAINLLSEWFENNQGEGKELFAELYRIRAELFMNTIEDKESLYEVMKTRTNLSKLAEIAKAIANNPKLADNFKNAEDLTNLLKEFNADNISDLKKMLQSVRNGDSLELKQPITKETLVSLGVTSMKEFEALKEVDITGKFIHVSNPTKEMFKYAQSLIQRAKRNIIAYLSNLPNYDCSEIEELANTVVGGIKKDGILINVVMRPSDNREVIIYYSSEKDALEYSNAELWIDNGIDDPRHLTLGKILKTTGINRIPV